MKKTAAVQIRTTMLFLTLVLAVSLLPFVQHAKAGTISHGQESPVIQYEEEIGPPPVPDTPRAPEPGEMYDPALSPDSAITEPDPLFDQPEPVVEQPEPVIEEPAPYVEEAEPLVEEPEPLVEQPEPLVEQPEPLGDEPEPLVPEGEPLGDREAEGRGIR